jgi:hypothetical protein
MSSDLDALVSRARAALDGAGQDGDVQDPGPYLGSAADGSVRAEVTATGRVTVLAIEPLMFRQPLEDVASAVRAAINAALDARPGTVDLSPVIDVVRAAQVQARRQMDEITRGIADVTQHVRSARTSTAQENG